LSSEEMVFYGTVEPVSGEVVFIADRPKRERPVYLDNCGDTYFDGVEERSYCCLCYQEHCFKRDVKCDGTSPGGLYDVASEWRQSDG